MELPGTNMKMLPSGENDILSLATGNHPILHHIRASLYRLCLQAGLQSIPMVLMIKVETLQLSSADGWDLEHLAVLIYRIGDSSTKKHKNVKFFDGEIIVKIDR